MEERYKVILADAQTLLDNVDADEFINTFLGLQDDYQGAVTVGEFLKTCQTTQEKNG